MDATPRRPDHITNNSCSILALKGNSITDTASGLAIKVKNSMMMREGIKTSGKAEGVTNNPNKRKSSFAQYQ